MASILKMWFVWFCLFIRLCVYLLQDKHVHAKLNNRCTYHTAKRHQLFLIADSYSQVCIKPTPLRALMRPKIYVIYDALQISPSSNKLLARKPGFHAKQGQKAFCLPPRPYQIWVTPTCAMSPVCFVFPECMSSQPASICYIL
jgi:hypothetical protein